MAIIITSIITIVYHPEKREGRRGLIEVKARE
jgi:hypothetical protein